MLTEYEDGPAVTIRITVAMLELLDHTASHLAQTGHINNRVDQLDAIERYRARVRSIKCQKNQDRVFSFCL